MPNKESDDLPKPQHIDIPRNKNQKKKNKKKNFDSPKENNKDIEKQILENLISLQKVNTNMSEKFDNLTKQLSALLELFEGAAKSFGQTPGNHVSEKDKAFLEKVDKLLEQNKTIAKGLTLMEEGIRGRAPRNRPIQIEHTPNTEPEEEDPVDMPATSRALPRF